jgi:hypothetical protein
MVILDIAKHQAFSLTLGIASHQEVWVTDFAWLDSAV